MARHRRTSFVRYLARQLKDPEFASAYLRALSELRSPVAAAMVKRLQSSSRRTAPLISESVFTEKNAGGMPKRKRR